MKEKDLHSFINLYRSIVVNSLLIYPNISRGKIRKEYGFPRSSSQI